MPDRNAVRRFGSWAEGAERILLIAHHHADGDAIGSVTAMYRALLNQGKQVTCVTREAVAPAFQFLYGATSFKTDFLIGDHDMIIAFDCGDARRTGFDERLRAFAKTQRRFVNIDQHPKNDLHKIANLNIIDYSVAATTQILYRMFLELAWPIDHHIATALLCGLFTDTGGFKHPNTTPEVLEIAADLLARGGRLKEINRHLVNPRRVPMLKLWGVALDRLQFRADLGIACSMITLEDLAKCGADHNDVAGVVNLIKNIPETRVAILFAEQLDGSIRASLRTENDRVDVAKLAALFGGGGLKKSGGFTLNGKLIQASTGWDVAWTCTIAGGIRNAGPFQHR